MAGQDFGKAIEILAPEAQEEKGQLARLTTFIGALAISDLVKTTLGPKGMDKILMNNEHQEITVTNDGATILKSVPLSNPSAKLLVEIAKTQDDEVGDGTTSVVVLAGELLREGEILFGKKVHSQVIIEGWREASRIALAALNAAAVDNSQNAEKFREDLLNIARTTISSKILSSSKDKFATLAVDAVLRLRGSGNLSAIHVIKKLGAPLEESFLEEGFILEKTMGVGQPKVIENAKILIANTSMDYDKVKIFGATVRVDSISQVADIEEAERHRMFSKCDQIIAHGCNVFINRQLIYNLPEQYFTDKGIVSIEHADFDGIDRLALVTGGEIVSTFDHPELVKLGTCAKIEQIDLGEEGGPRTIVSGLVRHVPLEDLVGRRVVVLANLKPRSMRGVKSAGMLLCAANDGHTVVEPLRVPAAAVTGERVWAGDEALLSTEPATPNQVQKRKIWEAAQPLLRVNAQGVATVAGEAMVTSAGPLTAPTLVDAAIS